MIRNTTSQQLPSQSAISPIPATKSNLQARDTSLNYTDFTNEELPLNNGVDSPHFAQNRNDQLVS